MVMTLVPHRPPSSLALGEPSTLWRPILLELRRLMILDVDISFVEPSRAVTTL